MKVDTLLLVMKMQCPLIGLDPHEDDPRVTLHRVSANRIHALNVQYADCELRVLALLRTTIPGIVGGEIGWQWGDRDDLADDYRSVGLSADICPVCESSR